MLISKETTLQVFDNIPTINGLGLEPLIALRDVKEFIKAVPEVDAVPIDRLCKWLGEQGMLAPCYFNQDCVECELKTYWWRKKSECWKHVLAKWMEGQNGG